MQKSPCFPSGGPINTEYPYKQIFFPASIMTLSPVHEPIFQAKRIAAQDQAFDVITFAAEEGEVHFVYGFKAMELDVSDPQFILYPIWFQDDDESAPDPTEYVYWSFSIANRNYDGDLNLNIEANNDNFQSPVLDQWHVAGGGPNPDQEKGIYIDTITGDALHATNVNCLQFCIERQGNDQQYDTYDGAAHLLGVICQYKTDFDNISQWGKI